MSVEARHQLPQPGVLRALVRFAPQFRVVALRIQVVCVDEGGKDHADAERGGKARLLRTANTQSRQLHGTQREFPFPDRIRRSHVAAQTVGQRAERVAVLAVCEPRVVTGDAERQHFPDLIAEAVHRHLGSSGCVVAPGATAQAPLELRRVLAQVVQQTGDTPQIGRPDIRQEPGGPRPGGFKMRRQRLPSVLA